MKKVLITGATGSTGKNAIKKLLELKIPVRALVHKKDARSEQLSTQGVEIVEGDLSNFDSVSAAVKGITGIPKAITIPVILQAQSGKAQLAGSAAKAAGSQAAKAGAAAIAGAGAGAAAGPAGALAAIAGASGQAEKGTSRASQAMNELTGSMKKAIEFGSLLVSISQGTSMSPIIAVAAGAKNIFGGLHQAVDGLAKAFAPLSSAIQSFAMAGIQASVWGEIFSFKFEELSREVAAIFVPAIEWAAEKLDLLVGWFRGLSKEQQDSLQKWGLVILGITAVAIVVPKLTDAFGGLVTAIKGVGIALAALATPGGMITAVIGIGVAALAYKFLGLKELMNSMSGTGKGHRSLPPKPGPFEAVEATYKRIAQASRKVTAIGKSPEERTADGVDLTNAKLDEIRGLIGGIHPAVR